MPHYIYEARLLKAVTGPEPYFICGVDEAGRGPLAGPVVAAAVILNKARIPKGLNDSKQLDEESREELFPLIMEMAVAVGVGEACVGEIDMVNIRQATHLAMARAVRALPVAAHFALVDGNDAPALPCKCDTLVKGDGRSVSIAAASIIAKVTRDRLMLRLHDEHPGYNWRSNKGYGTPDHYSGLKTHGVTVHHRRSFAPIRELLLTRPPNRRQDWKISGSRNGRGGKTNRSQAAQIFVHVMRASRNFFPAASSSIRSPKRFTLDTNLANWATTTSQMSSISSPLRSRSKCPKCGSPLYYTRAVLTFLTGRLKRQCLAANCGFHDAGHYKIAERGYSGRLGVSQ